MRQLSQWKSQIERIWYKLSLKTRQIFKTIATLLIICLIVRSLPYFVPIHAQDLVQDRLATEFSDRHGLPLGTLLSRDRDHTAVVPLDRVSPNFIQAIIAAEDKRFYQHGALDLKAIARSIKDAINTKRITSGASTITMQLARMLDRSPRTLGGKIREIWLSWRLTAGMNKDEILAAYINRLPMGGNIYGLEAASRIYFGIPASDLNLAQASVLAGVPNNPTYFNPYNYWSRVKQRQIYVLDRMVKDGYINRDRADRAYAEKISLQSRQQGIIAAPHFLFWVANQLEKQRLTNIQTTIDRPLQEFVEAQVQQIVNNLAANNVHHAAALVIDNHTGEVLAYVGSPDYFDTTELGRNDGVQALRQPGSTLKPFLYELALETRKIHPNTVLADVPTHYAIPGAKLYSPTDYDKTFLGPVRVRLALANSLNIPAVRVLEKVGVENFLNRLRELGFEHLTHPPEYYGLGLALGSGEVSLWELARAYVTLARNGKAIPFLTSFNSQLPNSDRQLPIAETEWGLITDMLSDRYARATAFGVNSVLNLPFPAAVKTGTSSNFRDTWTVGFTTDYTVATWVGNFNGDRMAQVSGVTGAAPLWNRIMLYLHETQEPQPFIPPEKLVQRPICALSGLRPTSACREVVQEYFYPEDLNDYERNLDTFYQVTSEGNTQQYRLNLPQEYDEWLATQNSQQSSGSLKILSPRNGDVFLMAKSESNLKPELASKLEFKIATVSNQPVEWWLNSEKLNTSSNSLFWPMKPGNWTLQVKIGEMSDRVNFTVQLANQKRTRRGFSIANPPR